MLENDTDAVDELIRTGTQVEVPMDVQERLRTRLLEFRTRVEQRPPVRISLVHSLVHQPALRVMGLAAALLMLVTVGVMVTPRESGATQLFAAAAAQLKNSQSLQYTIVLNATPLVAVDFSYLAPAYRRLNCSWGIEVRTDGVTGKQIVLFHGMRAYLAETGKQVESQANVEDFAAQLRSLPQRADELLGEKWVGDRKLIGYRLRNAPPNAGVAGLKQLDIWIDAAKREAHHVDITVQEQGKPVHQMHIENIRVGEEIDRLLFDLTPPVGYTAFPMSNSEPRQGVSLAAPDPAMIPAEIRQVAPATAIVMPMRGTYAQTRSALRAVDAYLKQHGVTPSGPPFGRYPSEQHWDAGYVVPAGTHVEAPFERISLAGALAASASVKGEWAKDSGARWAAFLKSVVEQGYAPAGPPMEIWSGDDSHPASQSTEMRIPVAKAK